MSDKSRSRLLAWAVVCLLPCLPAISHAGEGEERDRFSKHYVGFNFEWDFRADLDEPMRSFISSRYLGVGAAYGYERHLLRPRLRANLGWVWGAGFTPTVGLELPIFERLSDAMSKLFGVYLTGDVGWAFGYDNSPILRTTCYVRVPLGAMNGAGLGVSYYSDFGWTVFLARTMGGYPLNPTR